MKSIFEGRKSDSPHIDMVWHGRVEHDYSPVCPANVRWNLLFAIRNGRVRVTAEGATTRFVPKNQTGDSEFLVIKFSLGTFMPFLPANHLLNGDAVLPDAASKSFWLNGSAWQLPNYENVETFVERLVRHQALVTDPLVRAELQDQPRSTPQTVSVSSRTVRRRFLRATGLTPGTIQQIERAQQAASLLEQGEPILDVVYQAGYADQPHLTRSLRRFTGYTPAQIMRTGQI